MLTFVWGLACLTSCDVGPTPSGPADGRLAASSLTVSHAEKDADSALARGDASLLGVFGYAREVPAGPEGAAYGPGRCKVRMIEGTSDDGPRDLNDRAREYARRYNGRIIRRADCANVTNTAAAGAGFVSRP